MESSTHQGADRTLRIALVSPPLDGSGGIGRLMSYVLENLDIQQVAVRHVDSRGRSSRPILSVFPLIRAAITIVALKASRQVDLAHINMSYRGSTVRKGVIAAVCRALRVPVVLHLHTCEYEEFYRNVPAALQGSVRKIFQRSDHVIVLGRVWEEFLVNELGVSRRDITILYNAAPGPSQLPSGESPTRRENVRLLFLGQLGPRKGVPELLDALSLIPELPLTWSVTMAGDGDIHGTRARASELGILDRITFTGWIDSSRVGELLDASDVLILPSHAEGFPMAIVEAFAHGVAVISTPVGAIPELVLDGESGLLVPAGDVELLKQAIERLCRDQPLRERLGLAGRHIWETQLGIEQYARRLTDVWLAAGRLATELA